MYFTGATAISERALSVRAPRQGAGPPLVLACLTVRSGPGAGSGSRDGTDGGRTEGWQVLRHSICH